MKSVLFDRKQVFPSKIVCVGRNYLTHIHELNNDIPDEPVIFCKPNSALSDQVHYLKENRLEYEGELSFLIKQNELKGVGIGLDLTKRDIQEDLKSKGLPWEKAKAFNNSAVFSKFISLSRFTSLSLNLFLNNILVQRANIDQMTYKPIALLDYISKFISFDDNDILMTGTPKGVATYHKGDIFRGELLQGNKTLFQEQWTVI